MELYFLLLLIVLMAIALASGYPVAFALPGSAILSIAAAAGAGYFFADDSSAYFHQGNADQWLSAGVTNLRGVYWEVERDTLIAIPLFIFMGIMLQRSKIAEDLLMTMAQLFGPIRGGLGISVVFVGALLAATTGILGATVVAMGLISLPAMLRNNYSVPLATGTIAASGTLGQIIPPSIVLIILADQLASAVDQAGTARQALYKTATGNLSMPSEFAVTSTSAGEMFLGAFVPGLLLVGLYMLYILVAAFISPKLAPAVPRDGPMNKAFAFRVVVTLVPPLALIFLVLGSILAGIATVNQAGAIGAAGAILMAGYRLYEGKRFAFAPAILGLVSLGGLAWVLSNYNTNIRNISTPDDEMGLTLALIFVGGLVFSLVWSGWRTYRTNKTLNGVMVETAKTTCLVFIILLGAAMLTAAFRAFGGEDYVRDFLNSLPGGFWTQFLIVMLVIFLLGFFLDFIEIAVVVVPIVAPILLADPSANITAVWLGVMIGLNIQTSFLTPPFGFALFYLRGVAPKVVKTIDIYKGVIPFIALQLAALAVVGYTPQLVNYLPNRVSFTSDTAPPPRNPKLQYCLEEYVAKELADNGTSIQAAIESGRTLDVSYLPKKLGNAAGKSFDMANKAITLLSDARAAERVVVEASPAFRPLHTQVRNIQKEVGKLERRMESQETTLRRLGGEENTGARAKLESVINAMKRQIQDYESQVPSNWEADNKAFSALVKTELTARQTYRRTADRAYEPIGKVLETLAANDDLQALGPELKGLVALIEASEPADLVDPITEVYNKVRGIEGANDVRSAMTQARRAVRARTPDKEKALASVQKAIENFEGQLVWRARANAELAPKLRAYDDTIKTTIGARMQPDLSESQALFLASCNAGHRDVSLSF